jgi:hypothetical protein
LQGYQLGELNEWSKKTTTELATRVPLIIRAPMLPQSAGARTTVRAELVDLYRTLVDLAGLDASAIQPDVQGVSLAPLLKDPASPPPALAAQIAYSQIGKPLCKSSARPTQNAHTYAQPAAPNRLLLLQGVQCQHAGAELDGHGVQLRALRQHKRVRI